MKKIISTLFIMALLLSFMVTPVFAIEFPDVPSTSWAYEYIMNLADQGVISGYTDGTYKPEKEVTRGEFFKLIMIAAYGGNEYFEQNNFNIGHWASPYAIEAAMQDYLMDGTTVDNLNDNITRKEMVNVLAKICVGLDIYKVTLNTADFTDTAELDEKTKVAIDFVVTNGLINGYTDGTFRPDKSMTRAEVAAVLTRFLENKEFSRG